MTSIAHRDPNFVPVGLGLSSVDGITPVEILADASTGRLLIAIVSTPPATTPQDSPARRDANHIPVALGEDGSGNPLMWTVDSNGYLLLDLEIT